MFVIQQFSFFMMCYSIVFVFYDCYSIVFEKLFLFYFLSFFPAFWQVRFCSFLAYKGRTYVLLFVFLAVSEKTKMGFVIENSVLFFRKPSRAAKTRNASARLGFRKKELNFQKQSPFLFFRRQPRKQARKTMFSLYKPKMSKNAPANIQQNNEQNEIFENY